MASSREDTIWKTALQSLSEYKGDKGRLTRSYGGNSSFLSFFKEKSRQFNVNSSIFVPSLLTSVSHLMKNSMVRII